MTTPILLPQPLPAATADGPMAVRELFAQEYAKRRGSLVLLGDQEFRAGEQLQLPEPLHGKRDRRLTVGGYAPRGLAEQLTVVERQPRSLVVAFPSGKVCAAEWDDDEAHVYCSCGTTPCKHRLATLHACLGLAGGEQPPWADPQLFVQHRQALGHLRNKRGGPGAEFAAAVLTACESGYLLLAHATGFGGVDLNSPGQRQLLLGLAQAGELGVLAEPLLRPSGPSRQTIRALLRG